MRIAVVGCSHGSLDDIYASVQQCDEVAATRNEPRVDLVICCGDFQVCRLFLLSSFFLTPLPRPPERGPRPAGLT